MGRIGVVTLTVDYAPNIVSIASDSNASASASAAASSASFSSTMAFPPLDLSSLTLPSTCHTVIVKPWKDKLRVDFSTLHIPRSVRSLQLSCGPHLDLTGLQQTCTLPSTCTSIKLSAARRYDLEPHDIPISDGLKAFELNVSQLPAAGFERLSGLVLTHPTLTDLHLPYLNVDQLRAIKHLPPNLRTLEVGCISRFGRDLIPIYMSLSHIPWPQSLTSLTLTGIDTPLHALNLPTSLLHLTMLCKGAYSHPLTPLPPCLQSLHVEAESIHPPDTHTHPFPHSLTALHLDASCASIHSWREVMLPPKLRTLYFNIRCIRKRDDGRGYEPATGGGLPSNMMNHPTLTDLRLPGTFNHPIHSLPPSLIKLRLGILFNRSLDNVQWPSSLRAIIFSPCWRQPVTHLTLPDSITDLVFGRSGMEFNYGQPNRIANLRFPPNLQTLNMYKGFNASHEMNQLNLQHTTLTSLDIRRQKKPLLPLLPNTLRRLSFRFDFNQPIHTWHLPSSITELELGDEFNQPLDDVTLPASLLKLKLGESFNQPVENIKLPPILHTFIIANEKFDQPIEKLSLPSSLRVLSLSAIEHYTHPMSKLRLPPHLHSLSLPISMLPNHEGGCGSLILPVSLRHLTYYVLVDGDEGGEGMSIEEVRGMIRESGREREKKREREMARKQKRAREERKQGQGQGQASRPGHSADECMDESESESVQGVMCTDHDSAHPCHSDSDSGSIRLIECKDGRYRPVWFDPFDGGNLSHDHLPAIQLHRRVGKLNKSDGIVTIDEDGHGDESQEEDEDEEVVDDADYM